MGKTMRLQPFGVIITDKVSQMGTLPLAHRSTPKQITYLQS